jgi:hypothetical protein
MAEKTDIVVPEKVLPSTFERTLVTLKICGNDSLFPFVPFPAGSYMKAAVGANEGVLLDVPYIYRIKYPASPGKRIAVWMTVRIEEEDGEEPPIPTPTGMLGDTGLGYTGMGETGLGDTGMGG